MATVYVDSAAAGANDGTSWADAYTSIASATGAAAGDTVKVEDGHSQTALSANLNFSNGTRSNPVRIYCVDKSNSDALSTGAIVGWNSGSNGPQGNVHSYGVRWQHSGTSLQPTVPNDGYAHYEQCSWEITGGGTFQPGGTASLRNVMRWTDCNVDMSGSSSAGNAGITLSSSVLEWVGGTYTCRGTQTDLFRGTGTAVWDIRGVTFSGTVTNVFGGSSAFTGVFRIRRCVAPSFTSYYGTPPSGYGAFVELDWAAGTLSAALLPPTARPGATGTVAAVTSRYRTGGADDGSQSNAHSWEMAANSGAADFFFPLASPPITRWVAAGSQTVTVYVASGTTLQDDEFWVEVLSPSEAGSPTAAAKYRTTRPAVLAAPADLTSDGSSTWNGSNVGTKQKVSVTIAPTVAGPVVVRCYLAKASTTAYVDPVLDVAGDVAGKSRIFEGVQTFSPDSGGGTTVIVVDD